MSDDLMKIDEKNTDDLKRNVNEYLMKQNLEKYINDSNNYLKQINYLEDNLKKKENDLKNYKINKEKEKNEIQENYKKN